MIQLGLSHFFLDMTSEHGHRRPNTYVETVLTSSYLETTGFDETVAHFGNTSLPGEMTNSKSEESEAMENQAEFLLQSLGYGNGTNDGKESQVAWKASP